MEAYNGSIERILAAIDTYNTQCEIDCVFESLLSGKSIRSNKKPANSIIDEASDAAANAIDELNEDNSSDIETKKRRAKIVILSLTALLILIISVLVVSGKVSMASKTEMLLRDARKILSDNSASIDEISSILNRIDKHIKYLNTDIAIKNMNISLQNSGYKTFPGTNVADNLVGIGQSLYKQNKLFDMQRELRNELNRKI